MKKNISNILNSIKSIKSLKTKPFFYTRLFNKIESLNHQERIYIRYERPALITSVIILVVINFIFVFNNINKPNDEINYTLEDVYFESEKSDIINLASYEE